jgi:hypothetical protein
MKQTIKNTNNNMEFILQNIDNYNPTINVQLHSILTKFLSIIFEYLNIVTDKIEIKNRQYFNFIVERGIETIIHVFTFIFYYTKNLELTYYHSQKAYYFYIEFIEQISDDNITYLQLSSRDAISFVYKKTIYDINSEYRKNLLEPNIDEKLILEMLDEYISLYKNIVIYTIHNTISIKDIGENCFKTMENITEDIIKYKKKTYISCLCLFSSLLININIDIISYYILLTNFTKKIIFKKKLDEKFIKNKLNDIQFNYILNYEQNKIIDFIFSPLITHT